MEVRRKIAVLLAAFLVALGVQTVVAQPAHAAWSDCTPPWLCLWNGDDGSGTMFPFYAGTVGCHNLQANRNDWVDSAWNRSSRTVQFYKHANCLITLMGPLPPGWGGTMPIQDQNETSSIKVL